MKIQTSYKCVLWNYYNSLIEVYLASQLLNERINLYIVFIQVVLAGVLLMFEIGC